MYSFIKFNSEEDLFKKSLVFSILFHLSFWAGGLLLKKISFDSLDSTIEIDLTKPFRIGGNPLLKPGGGTTLETPKRPGPPPKGETTTQEVTKPKEWILPGPHTKELEKPKQELPPKGAHPEGIEGGWGEGYQGTGGPYGGGDGEGGGVPLTRIPSLLNGSEIKRLLRRNYPRDAQESGQEGIVIVDLHINVRGEVTSAEIVGSAGVDFDRVALDAAKKMKFSPAMIGTRAVAVKIRQGIEFKIEE